MFNETFPARFWKKVIKNETGCWGWKGARDTFGYGVLFVGAGKQQRLMAAHRGSWIMHFGDIPPRLLVLHHCDNPPCTNPEHLFLGTKKENTDDCVKKGRRNTVRGEKALHAKLTREQVLQIRAMYMPKKCTLEHLGNRFGVSKQSIRSVIKRTAWAHV